MRGRGPADERFFGGLKSFRPKKPKKFKKIRIETRLERPRTPKKSSRGGTLTVSRCVGYRKRKILVHK
jgi:hypothetical protein